MPINTNTFESNLTTKINATSGTTDAKEFLLLGKAIEAVTPSVTVQDVIDQGDTEIARVQTEGNTQVAAVQAAGSGYAALTGATFTGGISGTTASFSGDVSLGDDDKVIFGAGNDLSIYHAAGGASIIEETGGGDMIIRGSNLKLRDADNNDYIVMNDGGAGGTVIIKHNNNTRIETTSDGVDVTGTFIADSYNETYSAVTSTTNLTTVDCSTANTFSHTLTENTAFSFVAPPASGTAYTMTIEVIQDASASGFVVTWPTSIDWPAATAPTLTATASAKDVFVFTTRDGGVTWYGFTAGQALA